MRLNSNIRNFISLFFNEFISRFISFIAVTYLARVLGTTGFGIINIGLAVLSYLMVIATSGLTLLGTKKIVSGAEDSGLLAGNILLTRFALSAIILLAFILSTFLFVQPGEIFNVILIYSLFLLPSSLLLEWFFHGNQKMDVIAVGRTFGTIAYLLALILFVRNPHDTVLAGVAWVLGGIVNALYLFLIFKKNNYPLKYNFNPSVFFRLIKESFSLGAASIITQFVIQFPVIYLGIVLSNTAAGIYSAAYKIIILILVVDRVFNALFFPKIVQYIHNKKENLDETFNRILKIISVLGLSVLLISLILAEIIVETVFGIEFKEAVLIFMILLGSFYFTLLNSVLTYTLIAMNREKVYVVALICGTIVFFAGIISLTNLFGAAGASASYVLFEFTSFIMMGVMLKKNININFLRAVALPAFFIIIVKFALFSFISLPLQIIIAVCAVIPVILYLAGIGAEEFRFIKRIFV